QIYPLSWLVEKFWPVKGWTDEDLAKLKANVFQFKDSKVTVNTAEIEPVEEELADTSAKAPEAAIIHYAELPLIKMKRGRPRKLRHVTIIGYGWVGKSVHNLFPDAYIYDPPKIGRKQTANEGEIA